MNQFYGCFLSLLIQLYSSVFTFSTYGCQQYWPKLQKEQQCYTTFSMEE